MTALPVLSIIGRGSADARGKLPSGSSAAATCRLVAAVCLASSLASVPVARAGTNAWTSRGLEGIYVVTLAIDPANPAIIHAGTACDGVFKSTDGGISWSANADLPSDSCVLELAIDPLNPTTLYAGTHNYGLFKSTDGGSAWDSAIDGLPPDDYFWIGALAIDPKTPMPLYATPGGCGRSGCRGSGVFKSEDTGTSWRATGLTDGHVPSPRHRSAEHSDTVCRAVSHRGSSLARSCSS